jgi:DNA replication protein DnaC
MARRPEPQDPLETLRALLVELNLTTLARELPGLLSRAEASAAPPAYSEFLRQALAAEQAARTERKIQRRLRWSKLGPPVTLDRFDWSARPQLAPSAVKELLTCRFIEEKRNLILVGRPSLGKTTVATAIGHAACQKLYSVYKAGMADLLEDLHAAKADGSYRKVFRRVTQPDLLILDDAGLDTGLGRDAANELFRVVCARYRQRSSIVISNLPFKQWGTFLPSPAQAVAIADRLVDGASILRFTGKPFRVPKEVLGAPLDGETE